MLSAADICKSNPDRWIDCAKEVVRKVEIADPSLFEKKLIYRLMYLKRSKRKRAVASWRLAQ